MDIFSIKNWMCCKMGFRLAIFQFHILNTTVGGVYVPCWRIKTRGMWQCKEFPFVSPEYVSERKKSEVYAAMHAAQQPPTDDTISTPPQEESTIDDDTRERMGVFYSVNLSIVDISLSVCKKQSESWNENEKKKVFLSQFSIILYLSLFLGGLEGRPGTAVKLNSIRVKRKVSSRLKSKHRAEVEENENWCRRALRQLLMNISLRNED